MSNESLQFLEREKKRLTLEIDRLERVREAIKKQRTKPPHLCDFAEVLRKCHAVYTSTLPNRLERIAGEGMPAELASLMISDLYSHIKDFCDTMHSIAVNALEGVARELYYLLDQFLDYHTTPTDKYIVFIHDQIAVQTFGNLLLTKGFDKTYPEFWEGLKDVEFYFVSVTESMAKGTYSLNWPLILHEMAHIVCYHKSVNMDFLKKVPMFGEIEIDRGKEQEEMPQQIGLIKKQDESARMKRHITEFLADIMVSRCFGVVYGWRLFEMYGALSSVFEPTTDHPSEYKRIELIATELEGQMGRRKNATFLRRRLPSPPATNPAMERNQKKIDAELGRVLPKVRSYSSYVLTNDQEKYSLRSGPWSKTLVLCGKTMKEKTVDNLQKELFEGKPIILEPPALYSIAVQNPTKAQALLDPPTKEDKERADKILELLAECIRLYEVQREFATNVEPLRLES